MATSTYNDTTTATLVDVWTLVEFNPGWEYRGKSTDQSVNERRQHNVLNRYRILQGPIISYQTQEGQVGVGQDLATYTGNVGPVAPSSTTAGYLCTSDTLVVLFQGTGIFRQVQTWEHFTTWEDYDEAELS